jgi:quercetin dioxygenase-like cupin family protein
MVPRLYLALLTVAGTAAAQSTVEIENQWVRVLRVKLAPHEKAPEHEHPDSVAVYLTDLGSHKAGEVAWFEATKLAAAKRAEENLSDHPAEYVLMELKPGAPKAKGWPVTLDPVKLDPIHHQVPLENTRVRVLRTILEPHLKGPTHDHPSYVVVYLTELHTTMTLADGKQVDNPRHPGELAWRDPYRHTTENVGDRTAVEIQIELK